LKYPPFPWAQIFQDGAHQTTGAQRKISEKCTVFFGHPVYDCKILEQQRSTLIRQIAARGGKWPPANNELVENYLNDFLRFIKSVNF
jgi:hypothetical protein